MVQKNKKSSEQSDEVTTILAVGKHHARMQLVLCNHANTSSMLQTKVTWALTDPASCRLAS